MATTLETLTDEVVKCAATLKNGCHVNSDIALDKAIQLVNFADNKEAREFYATQEKKKTKKE